MKLTVDYRQLTEENKQQRDLLKFSSRELWKIVRQVSFGLERKVKTEMPVDTGRARASWGHWTPGHLRKMTVTTGTGEKVRVTRAEWQGSQPTHEDAHWKEDEWDLSIEQGSNVEYIDALNEGHSTQAPRGFLDAAAEHAQKVLDQKVTDFIDRYW